MLFFPLFTSGYKPRADGFKIQGFSDELQAEVRLHLQGIPGRQLGLLVLHLWMAFPGKVQPVSPAVSVLHKGIDTLDFLKPVKQAHSI